MARMAPYISLFALFILIMNFGPSDEANTGRTQSSLKTFMAINGGAGRYSKTGEKSLTRSRPKGFALSAWGIIALVIGTIFLFMSIYYFILFYPLLCARERKYDVMESSPV